MHSTVPATVPCTEACALATGQSSPPCGLVSAPCSPPTSPQVRRRLASTLQRLTRGEITRRRVRPLLQARRLDLAGRQARVHYCSSCGSAFPPLPPSLTPPSLHFELPFLLPSLLASLPLPLRLPRTSIPRTSFACADISRRAPMDLQAPAAPAAQRGDTAAGNDLPPLTPFLAAVQKGLPSPPPPWTLALHRMLRRLHAPSFAIAARLGHQSCERRTIEGLWGVLG